MPEINRRRSVRDGTVDKADFFRLLADRRWHPLAEILYALKNKVPPEIASQYFTKHRLNARKKTAECEEPEETNATHADKVNRGRRIFVRKRLNDSVDHGFIRKRKNGPGEDDWEYAWARWFCWSCGNPFDTIPTNPNHICEECSQVVVAQDVTLADRVTSLAEEVVQELRELRKERDAAVGKSRAISSDLTA